MNKFDHKNQSGFTISSLMIGIAVALVCILASLQLYAAHRISTAQMKESSKHSRQLSSAIVVVEKQIMSAGYGMAGADANDVVVQNIASTPTTSASTSLYWRYFDAGMICRGLRETSELIDGEEYRVLTALGSTACNNTTALVSMPWDVQVGVLGNWPVEDVVASYVATNETLFDFNVTTQNCAPYRVVNAASHLMVSVRAPTFAELNGMTGVPANGVDVCLINTGP